MISKIRALLSRLKGLFSSRGTNSDFAEELDSHLQLLTDENIRLGLPPEEAQRQARLKLGSAPTLRESHHDQRTLPWLESFGQDIRFALRMLRKNPGFTIVAVLTLALGIGAMTATYGVMYGLLVAPFPYRDLSRTVTVSIRNTSSSGGSIGRDWFSGSEYLAFREQSHTFEDFVAYSIHSAIYRDHITARPLSKALVTSNTFEFYGVKLLLGRGFTPEDERADARVFVMAYPLWQSEFGGDPTILGTSFVLDGSPATLVGILPKDFDLYGANILAPRTSSAVSAAAGASIVGRIKEGVTPRAASADLEAIEQRLPKDQSVFSYEHFAITVTSLVDASLGNFRSGLIALSEAVWLLLLLACTNVANLQLSRATVRETEIAIRWALGAGRARLVSQLLTESLLLALLGCGGGCGLAYIGLKAVVAFLPPGRVPHGAAIALNPALLGLAMITAVVSALLCGLVPAIRISNAASQQQLAGIPTGNVFRHGRIRACLTVAQVALSIVLLIGAGLMLRTFFDLTHTQLPFDAGKILYLQLNLPRTAYYGTPDKKPVFFREVLPRIQALPGISAVTESLMIPPDEGSWTDIAVPGKPQAERRIVDIELCTDGYFSTLGLRLSRGRLLSEQDVALAKDVAVVNEELAKDYYPGENPIGQKIKFEVFDRPFIDAPHDTYFEIVGVIGDFKTRPEHRQYVTRPEAFLPASVAGFMYPVTILAKTSVDPDIVLKSVEQQVSAVDPSAAVRGAGSINDFLKGELAEPRFELASLTAFACIGLILAAIGIFSVMAYEVSLQTRETGIRMALGARPEDILRSALTKGLSLVAMGTIVGLCASVAMTRFLASQIWGISPTDPWTFGAAVALTSAVGLAACYIPARRATRVDPVIAIRHE